MQSSQWYVLKGEGDSAEKIGPFAEMEMIRNMQSGDLQDYAYVWAPHMTAWTPLALCPEFSTDRLGRVFAEKGELTPAFEHRKSVRANVNFDAYVRYQDRFLASKVLSISEGGALVEVTSPLINLNDEILLHVKEQLEISEGFNVQAQVIRKRMSKDKLRLHSTLHYAVRFFHVQTVGTDIIKHIIRRKQNGISKFHE